ncbi:MAG UNVERIFIED_CONTAM: hypothetical protein LVR18_24825 [Planctomycetaceae bacterium]|jgi:hypothetical protein
MSCLKILHTDRRCVLVQLPTPRVHELSMGEEVELEVPRQSNLSGQSRRTAADGR